MPDSMIKDERCELLREAAALGNLEKLMFLINAGTPVNDRNAVNGWTALHWAASRDNPHVVRKLLACGADATKLNGKQQTARMVAGQKVIESGLLGDAPTKPDDQQPKTEATESEEIFVPNYLKYPQFFYGESIDGSSDKKAIKDKGEDNANDSPPTRTNTSTSSGESMAITKWMLDELRDLRITTQEIKAQMESPKMSVDQSIDVHVRLGNETTRFVAVPASTTIEEIQALYPVPHALKKSGRIKLYADQKLGLLIPSQKCGVVHAHLGLTNDEALVLYAGLSTE